MGSLKDGAGSQQAPRASGTASTGRSPHKKDEETSWLEACLLFFVSATSWVLSIPILLVALGGALKPHVGWPAGVVLAFAMFSILVQVDQMLATAVVFVVTSISAAVALEPMAMVFAAIASGMTLLNGLPRTLGPKPTWFQYQCRTYRSYHKVCELGGGDQANIQPGGSFFACHPHGVLSVGWVSNIIWGSDFHRLAGRCFHLLDPTLRNKGLFARLFLDAYEGPHGGIRDSSRQSMKSLMQSGESMTMIPGAYQEATLFEGGRDRVVLSRRKGFVKFCLRYGYRLHPVYTFGESDTYCTLNFLSDLRLWLNNWGIPTVVFWGLPWCPLLPRRDCELRTFVGPALELPKIEEPTLEQVDEWHGRYVEELQKLFNRHKAEAGRPDAILEVL